jgi:hypothetical protein
MSELLTQFDYDKVKELVPKNDRDFEREYVKPRRPDEQQEDYGTTRLRELWDKINEQVEEINKEYAVVNLYGNTAILHEVIHPITGQPDIELSKISDFHNFFANRLVENPEKENGQKVSISKLWFKSLLRRQYERVVFSPGKKEITDNCYNLFRGFAVDPQKGDYSLMDQHIKEVIANDYLPVYYYIKAWMAHTVQEPGDERPGVAIVMRGGQGVGKGVFATYFGKIFGGHFIHIQNQRHLTGNFNVHLKDKLLVYADEAFWGGDKSMAGVLKGLITEKQIFIEPKGLNAFPVDNHMRFIIASNEDWIVPADADDRRMFVLDVSNKYQGNHKYFKALFRQMDNGGCEAMLYDLLKYDYSDVNLREFPRTEALLDQILRSASTIEKFWFEVLMEGDLEEEIIKSELYGRYLEFAKGINDRHPDTAAVFGRKMKDICPKLKNGRPRVGDSRKTVYFFPEIEECRQMFQERIRMPIDWSSGHSSQG